MKSRKLLFVLGVVFTYTVYVYSIHIHGNAYSGISVSFSESVHQQDFDFDKFKELMVKSSELLFHATRKRAYFGNFTLILPSNWTNDFCNESTNETPERINIYITNFKESPTLRALHSKGCSNEGEIIYLPLDLLNGDIEDLARQFLQQWSIYRYGVFEESPLEEAACYASVKGDWSPVGCYDVKIQTKPEFNEEGIPKCPIIEESLFLNVKSSLMTNASKALDFCDGSTEFPHNPVMPTLHNNLCEGKTVWSVIENSKDFKHGKNAALNIDKLPDPSFKCFQEPTIQLTFVVQTCSTVDVTLVVQELRYTLLHFLKNLIPSNMKVNLVTFSEDIKYFVELQLEDEKKLSNDLEKYISATEVVTKVCLLCGVQKAMNVSQLNSSSAVLVIAWKSALMGVKTSTLIDSIKTGVRFHLVLIKDTDGDAVPSDLFKAIQSTGGNVYSLPKPTKSILVPNVLLNSQLKVILSSVVASPLQVEDKIIVIHEGKYKNDTEVLDVFTTPTGAAGKLVYTMHCDLKGQINDWNETCTRWDEKSTTFLCGNVVELHGGKSKTWQYMFEIQKGVDTPICASVVLLFKSASSLDSFSLRGWLSEYVINPGENALIIYAEIRNKSPEKIYNVFAEISGPGMMTPFEIELLDNGNGDPDVKIGDGVYSRYFTSFEEKGTYTVSISAKVSQMKEVGSLQNELAPGDFGIVQKKVLGSYSVSTTPSKTDIIPPNRVADFRVVAIDHENSTATFQWTAPGDNYDFGQAFKYEIKYATHPANLQELYFDTEGTVTLEEVIHPQKSGEVEEHEFKFPKLNSNAIYYVALRTIDGNKNKAKISNIVQFFLEKSPTLITEPTKSSTEYTSSVSPSTFENYTGSTTDVDFSSTASSTEEARSTDNINVTDTPTEQPKQIFVFDTRYKILVSIVGAVILFFIIVNIIIWCFCWKKRTKSTANKKLSRKSSLRPPYNLNITYQHESESMNQSETDLSITNLTDQNSHSSSPVKRDSSPNYSYHTSKSLLTQSKSNMDSELGFKVVQTMPPYATSSLSRFAKRLNSSDADQIKSSVAQPQQPSNSNETHIYSLGEV